MSLFSSPRKSFVAYFHPKAVGFSVSLLIFFLDLGHSHDSVLSDKSEGNMQTWIPKCINAKVFTMYMEPYLRHYQEVQGLLLQHHPSLWWLSQLHQEQAKTLG